MRHRADALAGFEHALGVAAIDHVHRDQRAEEHAVRGQEEPHQQLSAVESGRRVRMIGMLGMSDVSRTVCVFKGGNCLRQLDFLQVLLPALPIGAIDAPAGLLELSLPARMPRRTPR